MKPLWKKSVVTVLFNNIFIHSKSFRIKVSKKCNILNVLFNIINLFTGIIVLLIIFVGLFIVQFIEKPLRYFIYSGNGKDKLDDWNENWKILLNGHV